MTGELAFCFGTQQLLCGWPAGHDRFAVEGRGQAQGCAHSTRRFIGIECSQEYPLQPLTKAVPVAQNSRRLVTDFLSASASIFSIFFLLKFYRTFF
jgi:hypothetical protein